MTDASCNGGKGGGQGWLGSTPPGVFEWISPGGLRALPEGPPSALPGGRRTLRHRAQQPITASDTVKRSTWTQDGAAGAAASHSGSLSFSILLALLYIIVLPSFSECISFSIFSHCCNPASFPSTGLLLLNKACLCTLSCLCTPALSASMDW